MDRPMTMFPITTREIVNNPSKIVWVNPNMIRSIQLETWTVKATDSCPARLIKGTRVTILGGGLNTTTKLITEESTDSIIHRLHQL